MLTGMFVTTRDCAKKIRERTGLKPPKRSQIISQMLQREAARQSREARAEYVRSMSEDEFDSYVESYCAITPEGQNTKDLLLEIRAEQTEA